MHAHAKEKVAGKNVVGAEDTLSLVGKFMMSGMVVYMQRNLGLSKDQIRGVGKVLSRFVRGNTPLKLSENWASRELKEQQTKMIGQILKEEFARVLNEKRRTKTINKTTS